jgi:hypothetical protein
MTSRYFECTHDGQPIVKECQLEDFDEQVQEIFLETHVPPA